MIFDLLVEMTRRFFITKSGSDSMRVVEQARQRKDYYTLAIRQEHALFLSKMMHEKKGTSIFTVIHPNNCRRKDFHKSHQLLRSSLLPNESLSATIRIIQINNCFDWEE